MVSPVHQVLLGDMEYKLRIATAIYDDDLTCARYLVDNHSRLLLALVRKARADNEPADYIVSEFIKKIHERHLAGLTLK